MYYWIESKNITDINYLMNSPDIRRYISTITDKIDASKLNANNRYFIGYVDGQPVGFCLYEKMADSIYKIHIGFRKGFTKYALQTAKGSMNYLLGENDCYDKIILGIFSDYKKHVKRLADKFMVFGKHENNKYFYYYR